MAGLALFTLASFGCALSGSLVALTVTRVVQGFGAAGIMSVNTALVRMIYPPDQLGRGVSINATVVAISSVIGPTVASGVLAVAPWPWLFAINVPIGLAALAVGTRALPRTPGHRQPYDYASAIMNALVFGLAITAVDGLGHGEHRPYVIAEFIVAGVIGYFFVRRQLTQSAPLLPVDLMRIPVFALSIATSFCSFTAQMLTFVSLPFLLQDGFGMTQVQTGFLMTPWPLVIVFVAPLAGVLADRYSAGMLGGIGLAILTAGLLLLATTGPHPTPFDIAWRMGVCGLGFGLFQTPNNRQMLSSAPRNRSGGASGMLGTARLSGQTLGAALVAADLRRRAAAWRDHHAVRRGGVRRCGSRRELDAARGQAERGSGLTSRLASRSTRLPRPPWAHPLLTSKDVFRIAGTVLQPYPATRSVFSWSLR